MFIYICIYKYRICHFGIDIDNSKGRQNKQRMELRGRAIVFLPAVRVIGSSADATLNQA